MLLRHRLVALADLGYGVMEHAMVEAAAYVLQHAARRAQRTFVRLLKETDRPVGAPGSDRSPHRSEATIDRVFEIELDDLTAIPGSPMAYWMSESSGSLRRSAPLENDGADDQGRASNR